MKKAFIFLLFLGLLPFNVFSNPIDAVSSSVVGDDSYDMNGMEVTVTLSSGAIESGTWFNNSVGGTGWNLSYTGTNTSTMALDWQLSTDDNTTINNITIDAYANERIFFDSIWRYGASDPSEGTYGSDTGLWGPILGFGTSRSGTVDANDIFLPTTEQYDGASEFAWYWAFSNELTLNSYPATTPKPLYQDLFETLYIDFVNDTKNTIGTGMNGTFRFAVDTDQVAGREIPEPAAILLFGVGLLGLSAVGRKKG